MDPATGLPLHVAIEAVGLAVAGVLLTWAVVSRRWPAAVGAGALAFVQAAYAGVFIDDEPWASALRVLAMALIAAGGTVDRPLLGAGTTIVAAASVWRLAVEGDAVSFPLAPRLLLALGFVALAVWAARRAAASVRTRIVGAFLGVLGVAVVVAGSTAARVGVANAIDNAQTRLSEAARSEQLRIAERTQGFLSRGALASAVITQLGPSDQTVGRVRDEALADADVAVYIDRGHATAGPSRLSAAEQASILDSPAVPAAMAGRTATALVGIGEDAALVVATPVFLAGGRRAADVVGVLVVGDRISASDLEEVRRRAGEGTTVRLVTNEGALISSPAGAAALPFASLGGGDFSSGQIALGGESHLASAGRLVFTEPPEAALVVTAPVTAAADVAAAYPRGLVGGVLAAALLAVVIALWLSARITRPIVSLADEAERVKSEFLSTVSHELRTPLTPIRGYADLLRRERVPRRRAEAYLDEIDEAARRLERIVTLLVDVASIQAGRFTLELGAIAPDKLLAEAAGRWRRRSRRHAFRVRATKSLPKISADPEAITTVLDELLDNAVKFSPEGGTVDLRAARESDGIELSVEDEGIGMPPEEVERLTSAFVQAEPGETRRFGGLGLGLTYAAGVLAAHGSRLRVESRAGGGSTFSFTLPTTGMVSRMRHRARAR